MRSEPAQARRAAKKGGAATHAKLKFDRQILAIAIVLGASKLYTDDEHLQGLCRRTKIQPVGVADLPIPPDQQQTTMFDEDLGTLRDKPSRPGPKPRAREN